MSSIDYIVENIPLEEGDAGTVQILAAMKKLALRDAGSDFVQDFAENFREESTKETLQKVFNFCWKHFDFVPTYDNELSIRSPRILISELHLNKEILATVTESTTFMAAMLLALYQDSPPPLTIAFQVIAWRNRSAFTHVCLSATLDECTTILCDITLLGEGFGTDIHANLSPEFKRIGTFPVNVDGDFHVEELQEENEYP